MSNRVKTFLPLLSVLLLSVFVFTFGISWGLPSRAVDAFLFGDRTPWTGEEILKLAPAWNDDAARGADVDANPLDHRNDAIALNATDAQRAEIVRRYRLFSYQPDEMITFRALSGMKPGLLQLDPKLYQYGGLWVYPAGALLKVAALIGFVKLTPDLAFYLDHPDEFGKFYVVARAYSAAWGVAGVWAGFWLARRLSGSTRAAVVASICFMFLPVVVNMAHEAKPHLAGAVLTLLACCCATNFVETGKTRWAVFTGILCGGALGMVLSSLWAFSVIPIMVILRSDPWRDRFRVAVLGTIVGGAVYCATNPYVPLNAIFHPEVLRSNVGNSTAMYAVSPAGLMDAGRLLAYACGLALPVGVFGIVVWFARRNNGARQAGWILAGPVFLTAIQFVLLAAGKPGEYARFAILPSTALVIGAVVGLSGLRRFAGLGGACIGLVVVQLIGFGSMYLIAFHSDSQAVTSRLQAAEEIERERIAGQTSLVISAEPAPYVLPPVNLFDWEIVLAKQDADVRLVAESITSTPISWANKTFVLSPLKPDKNPIMRP